MQSHVEMPPTPPAEVKPGVPLSLNRAILRSLEKDPSRRFPSAEQFRQALMDIENTGTVSHISVLRDWVARAAAALTVIVSLVLVGSFRPSALSPAQDPIQTQAKSEPAPDTERQPSRIREPQRHNLLRRTVGKVWRLGRQRKSPSESGVIRGSESRDNPDPR